MQPLPTELLSSVVDDLPLGLCVLNPSGEVLYTNKAYLTILGMDQVPDTTVETVQAVYGIFDRQGRPYPIEKLPLSLVLAQRRPVVVDDLVVHRPDGRKIYLRVFGSPLGPGPAPPEHLVFAFMDISEEVRAAEARKQAEDRLAFAVDHAPIVLWMQDRHGTITLSEGAALRALGFGPGQLVGRSAFDLYKDQPQILENIRRVLAGESLTRDDGAGSGHLAVAPGAAARSRRPGRGVHRRGHRRQREPAPGAAPVPGAEDGGAGAAVRGDRPRLQQPAGCDPGLRLAERAPVQAGRAGAAGDAADHGRL